MNLLKTTVVGAAAVAMSLLASTAAHAQSAVLGKHPAYIHAMSDLRDARAYLDDKAAPLDVRKQDEKAIREIDAALTEIRNASIDDGKSLNDHTPIDASIKTQGRFARANELLAKAHQDVAGAEDVPESRGLRDRALGQISAAESTVHTAIETNKTGR